MPTNSYNFEFYNPWSTKNEHTTQSSITMPQMVNGRRPDPVLGLLSGKTQASGYYKLGSMTHTVAYHIAGGFIGECVVQGSTTPSPLTVDWTDIPETYIKFNGTETTGGAGLGGGFSGAVSRPTKTVQFSFVGNYSWVRLKLNISRGTFLTGKFNF